MAPGGSIRLDDDSWFITTEVTLAPLRGARAPRSTVRVQVLSIPLGSSATDGTPRALLHTDRDLFLGDDSIGLRHLGKGWTSTEEVERAFAYFVHESARSSSGAELEYEWYLEIATDVFFMVPVPVFGSPPREWQPLATLVSGGGASVATVAALEGSNTPATFILSFAGMTVLINVLVPATAALGRGVAHRIDRFMSTPPEPPATR